MIEISDVDLVKTDKQNGFIQGGDMTEVDYIESLGGEYKDSDGNKVDPFEFLSQNGMNMARIRLSNTPGKGKGDGVYYLPSGFQDEGDCLKLAKRAKDAGMGIQFTFNYSDYWSNGSRQIIPSEWVKPVSYTHLYAHKKGLDVVIMEPLLGGKLANPSPQVAKMLSDEKTPVEWAMDFLWNRKEVSLLLSGMGAMEQVQ